MLLNIILWGAAMSNIINGHLISIDEADLHKGVFYLPNEVKSIKSYAFASSNLKKAVLTNNIDEIPEGAFIGCGNLEEIELPKSIKEIGENAFYACIKLKKLIFQQELEP